MPWVALGLLLVFGSGLAFAAWSHATSSRVAVLVAASDIDAGDVIGPTSLRTEEVAAGPGLSRVTADRRADLVGKSARGPIPAGALLTPTMVSDGPVVPAGQSVVGAVLAPGAYPTEALRPGDTVELVASAVTKEPDAVPLSLGRARVWAITDADATSGTRGRFVSLLVSADDALAVTNASALQQLRLVLVGAGS
jgi:Flp pilus assembly protein CpaB